VADAAAAEVFRPVAAPERNAAPRRILLIAPHDSYRTAPFLAAARARDVEVLIASEAKHSLVSAYAQGLHIDLGDSQTSLQTILREARARPLAAVLGSDDASTELAALAGTALSTVRVVTCLDEQGRPEVTHAVLRMASSTDVVVDNFHAGGIAAAVDLATARLGPATDMGLRADSRWWDTHPVSGAPITGHTIPMWEQVPELARRAHEIFGDQVAIGWDIAVCEEGPLLVEGNKSPDLDIIQRIGREPLGNTRFGELLYFHVERAATAGATGRIPGFTVAEPGGQVAVGGEETGETH